MGMRSCCTWGTGPNCEDVSKDGTTTRQVGQPPVPTGRSVPLSASVFCSKPAPSIPPSGSTEFAILEDTWGQENPNYCTKDGNLNKLLCWSPISGGGSCYAIASLEVRWFALRQVVPMLPRLRALYRDAPPWIQNYTAGLLQNRSVLDNITATVITGLENGLVHADGVCKQLVRLIFLDRTPVMLVQRGTVIVEGKNSPVGHAVVAFGYRELGSKVNFLIADSNYPDQVQALEFDILAKKWSYYWGWNDFKVGIVVVP